MEPRTNVIEGSAWARWPITGLASLLMIVAAVAIPGEALALEEGVSDTTAPVDEVAASLVEQATPYEEEVAGLIACTALIALLVKSGLAWLGRSVAATCYSGAVYIGVSCATIANQMGQRGVAWWKRAAFMCGCFALVSE